MDPVMNSFDWSGSAAISVSIAAARCCASVMT
jgi:hypothetical protein